MRIYYVYILANTTRKLYIGVTNNLERRVYEHKNAKQGHTSKYQIHQLMYFEEYGDVQDAITREKQLKNWRRAQKIALIESQNPKWLDLAETDLFSG